MEGLTNSRPSSRACATDKPLHVLNPSSVNRSIRLASEDFASGSFGLINLILEELLVNSTYAFKNSPGEITFVFNVKSLARDLNRDPRTLQEALQDLQHHGCIAIVRESACGHLSGIRFTKKALCHPEIYYALLKKGQNIPDFRMWLDAQQSNEIFINDEVCQEAAQEIELGFASGEKFHRRTWTAMSRATRLIAEAYATGRLDLVVFILQELLLNTSYAFKRCGDITFGFRAEELADSLNRSVRSVQEVFQDLERCGFLLKKRGQNGLTLIRLTPAALSDSNVHWVLKTQGRNVPGFLSWLEAQSSENYQSETRESSPLVAPQTRESAPSPYKEYIKPSELKVEQSKAAKKSSRDELEKNENCEQDKNESQASAPGNSFKFEERLAAFVTETIHGADFKGSIRPRTMEEFDYQCREFGLSRNEILNYVDFKVWELSVVRQETYCANTVLRILTLDLVHHKAVTKNLEYLKRCEARRMYSDQLSREYEARQLSRETEIDEESSPSPTSTNPVDESIELHQWQTKLKDAVSTKTWTDSLSKLSCDSKDTTSLIVTDSFQAHWIAREYGEILYDVLGTLVLRFEPVDGSIDDERFELQLLPSPPSNSPEPQELSQSVTGVRSTQEEPVLTPWQERLQAAVSGSVWRMFLKRLVELVPTNEGQLRLAVDDEFIGQYIFDRHSSAITGTLGRVVIVCSESKVTWHISPENCRRVDTALEFTE